MKVEHKGHITVIRDTQGKTNDFHQKFLHEYNSFKNQNLILDLTRDELLTIDDIKLFLDVAIKHGKEKKSLVLVANNVNLNDVPSKLTVVPTLLEAHDIIEMEEIERDLGF